VNLSGKVQGGERKQTTSGDEMKRRCQNWGAYHLPGRVQSKPVYCLDDIRHKGSANRIQALVWNVGTCLPDAKGEIQVEETTRMRVPMPGTGTDQLVVVRKFL